MRVLLADSRARTRSALRVLLGQTPGFEVAGEAGDAASLLAQVKVASPQLVLLDWNLRDMASAKILPALRSLCPDLRVIVLSGRPEDEPAVMVAGADAFVSKADPADRLLAAIHDCCGRQPGERIGGGPGQSSRDGPLSQDGRRSPRTTSEWSPDRAPCDGPPSPDRVCATDSPPGTVPDITTRDGQRSPRTTSEWSPDRAPCSQSQDSPAME